MLQIFRKSLFVAKNKERERRKKTDKPTNKQTATTKTNLSYQKKYNLKVN